VTLTIERLVTHCTVPRQLPAVRAVIDEVTRQRFAPECERPLRGSLAAGGEIVRIRRLAVQVNIPLRNFKADVLTAAWVAAFIRELFSALAHPSGTGRFEIMRFSSRAEFVAAAIRDLLSGVAAGSWEYAEFRTLFKLSTGEAVLALLEKEVLEIIPTLQTLERWGLLDRLFTLWNSGDLDRLFVRIDSISGVQDDILDIDDLIEAASLLLSNRSLLSSTVALHRENFLGIPDPGQRKLALELFLYQTRELNWKNTRLASPRKISHALSALNVFLHFCESSRAGGWQVVLLGRTIPEPIVGSGEGSELARASMWRQRLLARLFPEAINKWPDFVFSKSFDEVCKAITTANNEGRRKLIAVLEELLAAKGSAQGQLLADELKWISTDCAGLFFLIPILDRLQWSDRLLRFSAEEARGHRFVTYILAGLGLAILDRFSEEPGTFDPGLGLFAGWLNEPDLSGLNRFFAAEPVQTRRELLTSLKQQTEPNGPDWRECFDLLASHVVREFAKRIRGFGRSSRGFIVKNFIALPGRICVGEMRLVVVVASSPFNSVLHLCGMDDPMEAVNWLNGRRIEFQLEGL
jgi:hypothetical protein